MLIVRNRQDLRRVVDACVNERRRIGLVPTMGNLHAGHHSLIVMARERADTVIASIFVNPTQFGPNEDFMRYPRTPEADIDGLRTAGCDIAYLPDVEDLYPFGVAATTRVAVPEITDVLEGGLRPGHFDGVATVVAKLFNQTLPCVAVFGQKDYQQLLVIRRMTLDLGYPVDVIAAPIVRDADGLAMSSRNQYLDEGQRRRARAISATLTWMEQRALERTESIASIELGAAARLVDAGLESDYAVIRRAEDLGSVADTDRAVVALIAARAGATRLIDNHLIAL